MRWAGLGSVLGDGNTSTLTYNFGGVAAGVDYRFDPRFLVGIGVGYTHGTEWVNGFPGQAWTDSVSVAAYGSFNQGGFYVDALAGYAYYSNQLQRQMSIPGLQPRTATGSTGANQFLGQVETGYRLGIYAPASATLTSFGRLQVSSVTQNAFTEAGAQSLNLNVAQQITNSLRTVVGRTSQEPLGSATRGSSTWRCGWAGCTVRLHRPADHGRVLRRTLGRFHRLRRRTAARQRRHRLRGQHHGRRRHPDLPALRRSGRRRHRQPHAQCRRDASPGETASAFHNHPRWVCLAKCSIRYSRRDTTRLSIRRCLEPVMWHRIGMSSPASAAQS